MGKRGLRSTHGHGRVHGRFSRFIHWGIHRHKLDTHDVANFLPLWSVFCLLLAVKFCLPTSAQGAELPYADTPTWRTEVTIWNTLQSPIPVSLGNCPSQPLPFYILPGGSGDFSPSDLRSLVCNKAQYAVLSTNAGFAISTLIYSNPAEGVTHTYVVKPIGYASTNKSQYFKTKSNSTYTQCFNAFFPGTVNSATISIASFNRFGAPASDSDGVALPPERVTLTAPVGQYCTKLRNGAGTQAVTVIETDPPNSKIYCFSSRTTPLGGNAWIQECE